MIGLVRSAAGVASEGLAAPFLSGSRALGNIGMKNLFAGSGLGGYAARAASGALGAIGRSPVGMGAAYGGALGGGYGAFSDNTSILGGMAMGAGLGAGGVLGGRPLSRGAGYYNMLRNGGRGASRGEAASLAARKLGIESRQYIGNTMTKAFNGFSGMVFGAAG